MGKKCRKFLALLTMFAVIVTYSFSASIVSVYAGDEQGEANAKSTASEDETPAKEDPKPESKPEAEPEKPSTPETPSEPSTPDTPGEGGGASDTPDGESAGNDETPSEESATDGTDSDVEVKAEDGEVEEEEEVPPGGGTHDDPYVLKVGQSVTLESTATGQTRNHRWQTDDEADRAFVSNRGNTFTYANGSPAERFVQVNHFYQVWVRIGIGGYWSNRTETFYLKLLPQLFKVEFYLKDAGGSSFDLIDPEEVPIGGSATAPSLDPTKAVGDKTYKLYSWYTDESCTTSASLSNITEDKKVYAKYDATDRIIFKKNLTGESVSLPDTIEEAAGTSVNLGSASCNGYTFIQWNTDPSGNGTPYGKNAAINMPEGGLTLYAIWEETPAGTTYINYWDTLSSEGSPIYIGQLIHTDEDVEINSRTELWTGVPSITFVHLDDIFIGWSTTPGGSVAYYPGDTIEIGEHHVDLYAVYDDLFPYTLDVTLTANSDEVTYDGEEHSVDGYVNLKEASNHPGYVLVRTRNVAFVGTYRYYVRTDATTAKGTDVGHYSTPVSAQVYYTLNNGALRPMNGYVSVKRGSLIINPAELVISTDSAEREYNGNALTAGGKVTFGDGQTATFAAEGEAVSLFKDDTLNIRALGSQTEVGSSENPYELDWGKPDDWGGSASTAKKFNYTIKDGDVGTLTVTPKSAKLTFVLNGGTLNGSTDDVIVDCHVGDEVSILQAPTREGYDFVEWQGSSYQPGDKYKVTGDHTFNAVWKSNSSGGGSGKHSKGGGAASAVAAASTTVADAMAAPETAANATIGPAPTPTTINDNPAPKSAADSWALINLICAILTALLSLIMLIRYFGKRKAEAGEAAESGNGNGARLASIIPAIGGIIAFIATENLANPMAMADKWTLLMIVILAVQAGVGIFAKLKDDYELEDVE